MRAQTQHNYADSLYKTASTCGQMLHSEKYTSYGKAFHIAPLYKAAVTLLKLQRTRLLNKNAKLLDANAEMRGKNDLLTKQIAAFEQKLAVKEAA